MSTPEQTSAEEKPCFWCDTKRSDVPEHLSPHGTLCPHYQPYVPPPPLPPSYGKIGYDAYVLAAQASISRPVPFYEWKELPQKLQEAWDAGCNAVVAARVRAEQKEESK